MAFQFRPILTLFTAVGLAVLLWLGTWQWNKVGPKTAFIAQVSEGLAAPRIALSTVIEEQARPKPFTRVRFSGRFRNGEPLKRYGASNEGLSGYHLYGLIDTDLGPFVATYGWTPFNSDPLPLPPRDSQLFDAVLLLAGEPGPFTPANDAAANLWYWTDLPAMATALGADNAANYLLVLEGAPREDLIPGQYRVDIPNNHFQYALTWYGLALTLMGVYLAFTIERRK